MNLFSKLANNSKLTSNKCKKHLKNNLCLYCGTKDHKLNFCSKKQTIVTFKDCNANPLAAAFKKLLKKYKATSRTLYKLRAMLNFLIQQQVLSNSLHPLFLILTLFLFLLLLP